MPGAAPEATAPTRHRAVLSLGSNLGDRAATLRDAVAEIRALPGVTVEAVSPAIETAALKPEGVDERAPAYLNIAVVLSFDGHPEGLLDLLNAIEADHGRVRIERWGDRTLDIDIVTVDEILQADARLTLPHPRAHERAFVLAPWLAIDPDAVLPGHGRVDALLAATGETVRLYDGTGTP
nr:2-amino-4-hydroxy-6-hydroxymethyldihydropteridine diphosphokinase [Galbitalea soli]